MARIGLGPWGNPDESSQVFDHSGYDGIKSIVVTHGGGIDNIRVQYIKGGTSDPVWLQVGGPGGNKKDQVDLDYPREYLVKIEGHYGHCDNKPIINLLILYTNRRRFGPFGANGETPFELPLKGAKIVGFHGKAGLYVSRLGVYVESYGAPISTIVPRNPGPWGGGGGGPWDDGMFTRIKQVIVAVEVGSVLSFQPVYELNGSSYSAPRRGKAGGTSFTIKFEEPSEHLERISGFFGPLEGYPKMVIVKALRFHTNKATYGPYGEEAGLGEFFSSSTDNGEILGFYGRSGECVDAIGVHIKYKN